MEIHQDHLKARGWTIKEINHAKRIAKHVEKMHPHKSILHAASFYFGVTIAALCAIAAPFFLLPLLVFSSFITSIMIIIILGLSLGTLFSHTIKEIEHLYARHHFALSLFIIVCGIVGFSLAGESIKSLGGVLWPSTPLAVLSAGLLYGISFLTPHYLELMRR